MPELVSTLQARLGVVRDLDAIHTWLDAIAGHRWRSDDLLQAIHVEGRLLLVAVERSETVERSELGECNDQQAVHGLVLAQRILDETTLLYMAVDPANRRRGIARLLLRKLQAEASLAGGVRIVLEVREGNTAARDLYVSCGFEEVGERRNYYPALNGRPGREHAIVLAWQRPA